jgi:hypothetical protein
MNSFYKYTLLLLGVVFTGCEKEKETPKVIYDDSKVTKEEMVRDSSEIQIADLPLSMEGANYLMFPVGNVRVYSTRSTDSYSSSKLEGMSYSISNYNQYQITGYLKNVMFQHKDSVTIKPLTKAVIQIQTVTYLKPTADKIKKQFLVYTLADNDTNKDGKIDQNDINSLYISDISGSHFVKLSSDLQELIDWNVIETQNRLYFRCLEDINKNGAFDKNDLVHYHYVDLSKQELKVEEYNPFQKEQKEAE